MNDKLKPGSKEAIDAGCKCPVIDNRNGKGYMTDENGKPLYIFNEDCRIHNG